MNTKNQLNNMLKSSTESNKGVNPDGATDEGVKVPGNRGGTAGPEIKPSKSPQTTSRNDQMNRDTKRSAGHGPKRVMGDSESDFKRGSVAGQRDGGLKSDEMESGPKIPLLGCECAHHCCVAVSACVHLMSCRRAPPRTVCTGSVPRRYPLRGWWRGDSTAVTDIYLRKCLAVLHNWLSTQEKPITFVHLDSKHLSEL